MPTITPFHRFAALLGMLIFLYSALPTLGAQETPAPTESGVYVTTQDYLNLREGPSTYFPTIRVIDPEVTLMAIGRTADTRWVQVIAPDGQTGWLFVRYLVYSGDVVTLLVDGVDPSAFVRQAGALGRISRPATIYDRVGNPIGVLEAGTEVELTGRLGYGTWSRFQFLYNGELAWVGAWDVRVVSGNPQRLFDTAYLYPYGRTMRRLSADLELVSTRLDQIESIWRTVANGGAAFCNPASIPGRVSRTISDLDARQDELFAPTLIALDATIAGVNQSISAYETACQRSQENPDNYITLQELRTAIANINDARINLNIAVSLYEPLTRNDPLIRILSDGR